MKQIALCGLVIVFAAVFSSAEALTWQTATVLSTKVAACAHTAAAPKDKEMPCYEYRVHSSSMTYRIRTKQQGVTAPMIRGQRIQFHLRGDQIDIRVAGERNGHEQRCVVISQKKLRKR
ncbi:MAG: hypothetical protein ACRD1I_02670 [Terriglobia bacterium]